MDVAQDVAGRPGLLAGRRSYRSREPLRVVGEYMDCQGHSPEEIPQAMKDFIVGKEPIDD